MSTYSVNFENKFDNITMITSNLCLELEHKNKPPEYIIRLLRSAHKKKLFVYNLYGTYVYVKRKIRQYENHLIETKSTAVHVHIISFENNVHSRCKFVDYRRQRVITLLLTRLRTFHKTHSTKNIK